MTLEAKIDKTNTLLQRLIDLIGTANGLNTGTNQDKPETEKPAKPKATKAKAAKAEKPAPTTTTEPDPLASDTPAETDPLAETPAEAPLEPITKPQLAETLKEFMAHHGAGNTGKEALFAFLENNFNVRAIGQLDESQYALCQKLAKEAM